MRRGRQLPRIQHTVPSRVIAQIAARHAAKTAQPAFEAAVQGVWVLNVDGTSRMNAGPCIHDFVADACRCRGQFRDVRVVLPDYLGCTAGTGAPGVQRLEVAGELAVNRL